MSVLECSKLKKVYRSKDDRTVALTNFSLDFPECGIVAIQGKSGSGKSTLLCLLAGVETPDSGSVYFNGKNIASFSKKEKLRFARSDTSFVFQHYGLFEDKTVYENIMLPLRMIGRQRSQTKESVSFLISHFGLEGCEKRKVKTLSGGEKQRVALIRALVKAPRVLFADEPTGALDEENGEAVMKMLSSMSQQSLIVMVSHNTGLVERYADRIITLKDGVKVRSKVVREKEHSNSNEKKAKKSSGWIFSFLKDYVFQDAKRNFLTILSGFVGLSSMLASIGYFMGSPRAIEQNGKRSLGYYSAYLSKKENVSVSDSPLILTRQSKPTMDEAKEYLRDFGDVSIEDDLSYFFPSNQLYSYGDAEYSDAFFTPIYDITLSEFGASFLKAGSSVNEPTLGACYVNDCFEKAHGTKIGDKIQLTLQIPVKNNEICDDIELPITFEVKGIASEFSFLNNPKVYYSYPSFSEAIKEIGLPNFSQAFKMDFRISDFIRIYPEFCLGRGYQVYFHSDDSVKKAFTLIEKGGALALESPSYTAISSFASLSEAFRMCLMLLLSISVLGIVGVTGMSFLSLFLKRKKEIALLFSLGASRGEVLSIFLCESGVLTCLYAALSIFAFDYLAQGLNRLLWMNFGMANLISLPKYLVLPYFKVPFLALFALGALLLSLLSSALPIALSMRRGLRKELRDE